MLKHRIKLTHFCFTTLGKKPSPFSDVSFARHRRLLGCDDHEVRILIQKPREKEPSEPSETVQMYSCQDCNFKTPRVEVIMMHKKSHLQGVYTALFTKPSAAKKPTQDQVKKSPAKKPRKSMSSLPKTKTKTIDEDIELLQKGLSIFEDKNEVPKKKEKKETAATPKSNSESKEAILNSILCEWDNDFEDESTSETKAPETEKKVEQENKQQDDSCFDFSEEEENEVVATTAGRKIPRVIPETKENAEEEKTKEKDDDEFMELMETTSVPKIPEVPSLLKCEQNFHDDAMIKFPDKPELPDPPATKPSSPTKEVATKLTNPKKRFVKSFEDFAAKYLQQETGESTNKGDESSKVDLEPVEKEKIPENLDTLKSQETTFEESHKEDLEIEEQIIPTKQEEQPPEPKPAGDSEDEKTEKTTSDENSLTESCSISSQSSEKQLTSSQEDESSDSTLSARKSPLKPLHSPLKSPEHIEESLAEKAKESPSNFLSTEESFGEKARESPSKLLSSSPSKFLGSPFASPNKKEEIQTIKESTPEKSPVRSETIKEAAEEKSPTRSHAIKESAPEKSPVRSPEKRFFSSKQEADKTQKSPVKSPQKKQEEPVDKIPSQESISRKISESLEGSSLKRFFEDKVDTETTDKNTLAVSKLKTQLMSKLSTTKSPKRNISEVIGASDPQSSATESVLPKYNKGKYRSRMYYSGESNSGLHVAKKRAVTSFEDFLEKKPEKPKEKEPEKIEEKKVEEVPVKQEEKTEAEVEEKPNQSEVLFETKKETEKAPPLDKEEKNLEFEKQSNPVSQQKEEEKFKVQKESTLPSQPNEEEKCETETKSISPPQQKEEETPATPSQSISKENVELEQVIEQELISEEVPMEIETEMLPTASFETNAPAQMDISALTTLATVSELSTSLNTVSKHKPPEVELVALDKNVTIVSEKELADGQVEFANDSVAKPLTLTTFSMDFSDSNSENSSHIISEENIAIVESKISGDDNSKDSSILTQEKKQEKNFLVEKPVVKIPQQDLSNFDIEEQIPPSIVSAQGVNSEMPPPSTLESSVPKPETVVSTRLFDILNDRQKKKEKIISTESKKSETNVKSKTVSISPKGLMRQPQVKKKQIQEPLKMDYEEIEEIDKFIIQKKVPVSEPEPEIETKLKPIKKYSVKPVLAESAIETPTKTVTKKLSTKTAVVAPEIETPKTIVKKIAAKPAGGKAKILQQTIITPAGDIIHPEPPQSQPQQQQLDDVMFDINSMPIVLGDQILQPDNIDSLPVVISESTSTPKKLTEKTLLIKKTNQQQSTPQMKILNKGVAKTPVSKSSATPTYVKLHPSQIKAGTKNPKMYQIGPKIIKTNPALLSQQGKQGKFIIVPSSSTPSSTKTGTEKKITVAKKLPSANPKQVMTKVQNIAPEPSGNKIMIVTNRQGQQSKVLLTPAQQKLFGYQTPSSKGKTTIVRGSTALKQVDATASVSNVTPKTVIQQRQFITTSGQLVTTPVAKQQITVPKIDNTTKARKTPVQGQRVILQTVVASKATPTSTKVTTAVIKNQQVIKKPQQVDEALLDQQVQEQLQAIKASGMKTQQVRLEPLKPTQSKQPTRRSYLKKPQASDVKQTKPATLSVPTKPAKTDVSVVPPLAPISPKKIEVPTQPPEAIVAQEQPTVDVPPQRPLNQMIIQDGQGNQTTITEGQILALPSETVDGQPSTYMLVTLDETGNLTPLNNEALMSLDPNLGLGGDLSNVVLQLDAGNAALQAQPTVVSEPVQKVKENVPVVATQQQGSVVIDKPVETVVAPAALAVAAPEPVVDPNQQFYVADPMTAQKLIESLTEGNADIANLLANAENNSILINADGQQILINANTDNQVLLTVNSDITSESTNNPIFAAQPGKSQDILAAALADTDVFQQDQTKGTQPQLSPNSALYPMNVGNVLETSLTLTSPIMTPLEVPSTNNKKIPDDEADILTQVPKNVDLPITITDPNISQTVAQQQVATLIANELQSNLELPLAISDANIVVATTELSSPSYGYSLPSLDDSVDMNQKSFSSSISMPILSEDGIKTDDSNQSLGKPNEEGKSEEIPTEAKVDSSVEKLNRTERKSSYDDDNDSDIMEEGLCRLGGEMCSSLSEPPPDMFDLAVTTPFMSGNIKTTVDIPDSTTKTVSENNSLSADIRRNVNDIYSRFERCRSEGTDATSDLNVDDNSCEIPLQPQIVTDMSTKTFDLGETVNNEGGGLKREREEAEESESKRIRAD